jgi:hypothetical protein
VLVGHSGGAALLLALLEHIETRVAQAILVAGYATQPSNEEEPVLQDTYDWQQIKSHVSDLYFINSVRDPYGCDAGQGRRMFDKLGGTQIVRDEGHFGDVAIRTPPSSCWTSSSTRRITGPPLQRRHPPESKLEVQHRNRASMESGACPGKH